jgi:hypothetical protein
LLGDVDRQPDRRTGGWSSTPHWLLASLFRFQEAAARRTPRSRRATVSGKGPRPDTHSHEPAASGRSDCGRPCQPPGEHAPGAD